MKTYNGILTAIMAATLALAGCSKKTSVDTTPLETNFKTAEPATQSSADKAVAAIKASDYPAALSELGTLAKNAKLTPEQKQAVNDVLAQVQKAIADSASKAAGESGKMLDDAKKSLPK